MAAYPPRERINASAERMKRLYHICDFANYC